MPVALGSDVPDMPATVEGRADVGIEAGVCRSPMAETELRRFFNAPNAEDCGRSMSRP